MGNLWETGKTKRRSCHDSRSVCYFISSPLFFFFGILPTPLEQTVVEAGRSRFFFRFRLLLCTDLLVVIAFAVTASAFLVFVCVFCSKLHLMNARALSSVDPDQGQLLLLLLLMLLFLRFTLKTRATNVCVCVLHFVAVTLIRAGLAKRVQFITPRRIITATGFEEKSKTKLREEGNVKSSAKMNEGREQEGKAKQKRKGSTQFSVITKLRRTATDVET